MISIKDLTKIYQLGDLKVNALDGLSLEVDQGEFLAIMGPSGSGKSTLLHILGLLDKPSSGSYKLSGIEISKLNDTELAGLRNSFAGFIFQSFNLLPRTTSLDNVLMPVVYSLNQQNASEKAKELLKKVGLGTRVYHKPNELSGGQQQRVAIARSLINNPAIIFADEPTGNLDTKSAAEIIQLLKELNRAGITIVMVTHEPDLAQEATRVLKLVDGKIVSDEKRKKLLQDSEHHELEASKPSTHSVFGARRIRDAFFQAIRALLSNKTRAFLSVLGVLIGVTGLIAMLALGRGAQAETKKQMATLGSNILMVMPGSFHRGGIAMDSTQATRFTLEDAEHVSRNIENVTGVAPYVSGRAQVSWSGRNINTRVEGTSPDYFSMKNSLPASGRIFTDDEATSRTKVALVGQTIIKDLFNGEDPIGEFIKINRIDFKVIGVLPAKGSGGFRDEDNKIEIPINTAMYRLFGKEYLDYMDVQISDEQYMNAASDKIVTLLLRLHRQPESKKDSISVRNMADIQATIASTMKTFSTLLGSIAFVSLIVGGIGIMNIMLVSVTERTKEIGLRKAIGADNKDILFQFITESIVICVFGGVLGIILGSSIAIGLSVFFGWKTQVSLSSIILSFTFSVLVGLIFGTWPAKKASDLSPIEALRYE